MPENDEYHWLTYESQFNKDKFKKPKCEFKLALYLIPLNELTIWLRDDISDENVQIFADAFFPDLNVDDLKKIANGFWSWKHKETDLVGVMDAGKTFICTPRVSSGAARNLIIIYSEPYAVLPYNRFDNTETSNAIGTRNHGTLLRIKPEEPFLWSAWKTASRSCVVKLPEAPVKPKGKPWLPINRDSAARLWTKWDYSDTHRAAGFENLRNNPYNLKNRGHRSFSLKTGVEWVGKENQGGWFHKDVIGDWLIGCLRSDYIKMVDKKLKPPKEGLIVLTELITITEKVTRTHTGNARVNYKEGVQIRDLSVLNEDKIYLAPLNIPFVGPDENNEFNSLKEEFQYLKDGVDEVIRQKWSDFWKNAFASALGRTKALFLLRYGLQILNPNQQNFLIEFEKDVKGLKPTGNIAIRDLNDASIHREVAWALFNGAGLPPQEREDSKRLAELDVPTFKFEFTEGRMANEGFGNQDNQETGSTPTDFGPPGTQFLWQRFSAFATGFKPGQIKKEKALSDIWNTLLWVMVDWGIAHNKSYINTIEKHLGKNFRDINWKKLPNPARYKSLPAIDAAEAQAFKGKSIAQTTDPGIKVTGRTQFNFPREADWGKTFREPNPNFDAGLIPNYQNKPCLVIYGEGFDQSAAVKFGNVAVNSDELIWCDAKKLYILNNDRLKPFIQEVLLNKRELTVTNPGMPEKSARWIIAPDPEQPGELGWEELSARVIHDYLKSAEGQKALRDCRDRGWKLVNPAVTVRFSGIDGKPFAWKRIFMKNEVREWTDLTNRKGEIYIYKENVDEKIQFCPQKDESRMDAPAWLECISAAWEGITINVA